MLYGVRVAVSLYHASYLKVDDKVKLLQCLAGRTAKRRIQILADGRMEPSRSSFVNHVCCTPCRRAHQRIARGYVNKDRPTVSHTHHCAFYRTVDRANTNQHQPTHRPIIYSVQQSKCINMSIKTSLSPPLLHLIFVIDCSYLTRQVF